MGDNVTSFATSFATGILSLPATIYDNGTANGPTELQKTFISLSQTLTMIVVVVVMFGLGCSVEVSKLINFAKSPKQFGTGISLQLLLMPVLGYTVTRMLHMTLPESLGVIFQSIVPGGTYSNLATYWLDGDMDLSVMMTSASTLLAMVTMPLWLWVFSSFLRLDENLRVPFKSLGIALATVSAPVIAGLIFRYFFEKFSKRITMICSISGSLCIIVIMVFLTLGGAFDYPLTYRTYAAAFIMSSVAVTIGYLATRLPCLNFTVACRRTVAIETAYQSTPVAFSVVVLSFSPSNPEVFGPMAFYPILYGLVQLNSSIVFIIMYRILKFFKVGWVLPDDPEQENRERDEEGSKPEDSDEPEKLLNGLDKTEQDSFPNI